MEDKGNKPYEYMCRLIAKCVQNEMMKPCMIDLYNLLFFTNL